MKGGVEETSCHDHVDHVDHGGIFLEGTGEECCKVFVLGTQMWQPGHSLLAMDVLAIELEGG